MSFFDGLFGGNESPQPAPVPANPSASSDPAASEAAQKERQAAADAALADSKSRGRQSTVFAGRRIAEAEQQDLMRKRKSAATEILG